MQNFVKVAQTSDLKPGQMKCVNVQDQKLLIANVGGHFYATSDTCTHEDASLTKGMLEGEWVKCPLHGSRFNIRNGQVQEEPAEEPLRIYPLRIENHTLLVDIS
jgi:3-phenylpropionate/trans-cinnamate dioxygenase ferredoxin subunit